MRTRERRVGALERLLRPLPPGEHELRHVLPQFLSFEEIERGQAALAAYDDDPAAALRAGDPIMVSLVAVARARRAVPEPSA